MAFTEQPPEWQEPGIEPPESKRTEGWQVDDKPPAAWLNWFFNRVSKVLQEIQTKVVEKTVYDAHVADGVKHVTATERMYWNAKESTIGAQAKADAAVAAALPSVVPITQKGAVNGVASLDATGRTPAAQMSLTSAFNSLAMNGPTTLTPRNPGALQWSQYVLFQSRDAASTLLSRYLSSDSKGNLLYSITGFHDFTVSMATTADFTMYVRTDGNDNNTGLTNTAGGAFRTIAKAVSMIPIVVNHTVNIEIASGVYAEPIIVAGKTGMGAIRFNSSVSTVSNAYDITYIYFYGCTVPIAAYGFKFSTTTNDAATVINCSFVAVYYCKSDYNNTARNGVFTVASKVDLYQNVLTSKNAAIYASQNSEVFSNSNTGTGSVVGIHAAEGGKVSYIGTQPIGSTPNYTANGGMIINGAGVVGPWGDSTTNLRTYVNAWKTVTQSVSANVSTKVTFDFEGGDTLGEYTPSTSRFSPSTYGRYGIVSRIGISSVPDQGYVDLGIAVNGVAQAWYRHAVSGTTTGQTLEISEFFTLNTGDYVEIYVFCPYACSIDAFTDRNCFRVQKVA